MKKFIYAAAIAFVFIGGCSQDEDPSSGAKGNVIGFSATAPVTRAAPTTTTGMKEFVVYAFTESNMIMDGVKVTKEGSSWTYTPEVYWPSTAVNFFAVSPDIRTSQDSYSETINGMQYGSTDLLYAVSMNQFERATPVPLSFRHALSRISVNLSCTNNKHEVKISYVILRNISLAGDFSFPSATTSPSDANAIGTWSNLSPLESAMIFYFDIGEALSLTPTPVDVTEGNIDASFFVPQKLEPFSFTKQGVFSGAYIEIDCEIFDKETGNKIWPTENTPDYLKVPETQAGRMCFPLASAAVGEWQQGYAYSYNIVINNTYTIDTIEFEPGVVNFTDVNPY